MASEHETVKRPKPEDDHTPGHSLSFSFCTQLERVLPQAPSPKSTMGRFFHTCAVSLLMSVVAWFGTSLSYSQSKEIVTFRKEIHPDASSRRQLRALERHPVDSLRYLILGTSDSWGAGIQGNRLNKRYSSLLGSRHVTNLAERSSAPTFPSLCLQSMIHDQVYDVVIIEHMELATQGLDALAQRVRQRFPNATIILMDLWWPNILNVKTQDGRLMFFTDWMKSVGVMNLHTNESKEMVKRALNNPNIQLVPAPLTEQADLQRRVARKVDAYIWTLPFPSKQNVKGDFLKVLSHYGDGRHLSEAGHAYVGRGLSRLIRSIPYLAATTASWESGDACSDWLMTPQSCPHTLGPGAKMVPFPTGKHAIEIAQQGGSIKVENPFSSGEATLYLTYMLTAPKALYPNTSVQIGRQSASAVELVPTSSSVAPLHISKTQRVGRMSPGSNTIWLKPLEEGKKLPFRLIGTTIVEHEDALPSSDSQFFSGHQVMGFK